MLGGDSVRLWICSHLVVLLLGVLLLVLDGVHDLRVGIVDSLLSFVSPWVRVGLEGSDRHRHHLPHHRHHHYSTPCIMMSRGK